MKVAFFPGCVSKGACPELYVSTRKVAEALGIELGAHRSAVHRRRRSRASRIPALADSLNGLTLAMAEQLGADLMTICSTCQGVLSNHNYHLTHKPDRMERANAVLAEQGFTYKGTPRK